MIENPMKSPNAFGINLRRLIKQSGLKYEKAAEKIGISLSFLNQLMNGNSNPSLETIDKICDKLNFKKIDLLGESFAEPTTETKIGEMTAQQFEVFFDRAFKNAIKAAENREDLTLEKRNLLKLLDEMSEPAIYEALSYFAVVNPDRLRDLIKESDVDDAAFDVAAVELAARTTDAEAAASLVGKKKGRT